MAIDVFKETTEENEIYGVLINEVEEFVGDIVDIICLKVITLSRGSDVRGDGIHVYAWCLWLFLFCVVFDDVDDIEHFCLHIECIVLSCRVLSMKCFQEGTE